MSSIWLGEVLKIQAEMQTVFLRSAKVFTMIFVPKNQKFVFTSFRTEIAESFTADKY